MIHPDITLAVANYRKAKRLVEVERQRVLAMLPEDVASEFHYNGMNAAHRYPEYTDIFKELRS
jgi:hypothetical protein